MGDQEVENINIGQFAFYEDLEFAFSRWESLDLSDEAELYRNPSVIISLQERFPNLAELSIGIESNTLNEFFCALGSFKNVQILTVYLTRDVKDFDVAMNFNLAYLSALRSLTFMTLPSFRYKKIQIENVHLAFEGFAHAYSLDSVTFKSIEVDWKEFLKLQFQVGTVNPNLLLQRLP